MSEEPAKSDPKRLNFGLLLLISFALFNLGYIVDQTIRWSDHGQGLINGLVHVLFFGMAWCLYMLPWSLMVLGLYRWRKWERFRTQWILAPSVLLVLGMLGGLLVDPPTPSRRFRDFAKIEMPSNVRNLRYQLKGGGIADYSDTYYFETTPEEVERIIAGMSLDEDKFYGREGLTLTSIKKLPDCPDFSMWKGARKYKGSDETMNWFYELITDDSRTKVYMRIGCI